MWRFVTVRRLAGAAALVAAVGFGARENLFGTVDARAAWALGSLVVMVAALAVTEDQVCDGVSKVRSGTRAPDPRRRSDARRPDGLRQLEDH
jgi:hypothetical protein